MPVETCYLYTVYRELKYYECHLFLQIIAGPQSANDLVRIELTENGNTNLRPIHARYLRIQSEVDNEEGVGLRLEVYGCQESSKSALCEIDLTLLYST